MLDEIVVSATVNPTDCELTSQKLTSLPHVFSRGRKAMQPAEIVHSMFAAVAVSNRAGGQKLVQSTSAHVVNLAPTVGHIEDDGSANEKGNDLNSIANRLELSCHRSTEPHISDDDCRE